jgi:hypothetical protein
MTANPTHISPCTGRFGTATGLVAGAWMRDGIAWPTG